MTIDFSPLTLLLGRSGSGKSNISDALTMLRHLISRQFQQGLVGQFWRKQLVGVQDSRMRFEAEFELAEEKYVYSAEVLANAYVVFEKLVWEGQCIFSQKDRKWVTKPQAAAANMKLQQSILASLPSEPAAVYSYAALSSIGVYDFGDEVFRFPGQSPKQKGAGFLDDGSNVIAEMAKLARDIKLKSVRKAMLSSMRVLNPSVTAIEVNSVVNPTAVVVTHEAGRTAFQLDLKEESAGFRRFLAILVALYQTESKMTVLFEHPEDGIHPGALSLLAEEFAAAPEDGRGQVILTSHSPQLLDCFPDVEDAIRVVEMVGDETKVGVLDPSQRDALREKLLRPGELLTTDDARMAKESGNVS